MTEETVITVKDLLQSAFQALMRNDLRERDRLCAVLLRAWPQGHDTIPNDTPIPLHAWSEPLDNICTTFEQAHERFMNGPHGMTVLCIDLERQQTKVVATVADAHWFFHND